MVSKNIAHYAALAGTAPWTLDGEFPPLEALRIGDLPILSPAEKVKKVVEAKTKARENFIVLSGQPRMMAAMEYDSEHAPFSNNATQLEEIGISIPSIEEIKDMSDDTASACLTIVICNLASLGIFFVGTDHMTDRAMLSLLCEKILVEKIRDIPPSPDMTEFLDLSNCEADREPVSRTLPHPYRPIPVEA
jgi:hypothetical protein